MGQPANRKLTDKMTVKMVL